MNGEGIEEKGRKKKNGGITPQLSIWG